MLHGRMLVATKQCEDKLLCKIKALDDIIVYCEMIKKTCLHEFCSPLNEYKIQF